ncbi:GNAT family N-acetyltransferase [Actinoallomurus purpureus]|uniref:RNA polymerase sigma factor n=1 Tax=Actinoallomurus purpureus TaxID=478114 RepID=UPI0020928112|nr:GNAT family N-acetyltransferase [Actinoallomurus purpureus]MCO6005347.1 GNAT family N-acetyltransferase [Actinoallomurus purpureus]
MNEISVRTRPTAAARAQIDLVHAAQQGDLQSLGLLLKTHYAGMYAVACSILGSVPDAEDVCQDAAITAMSRLGDLRDPAAVGPWLKAIVRNNCRMRLRARLPVPVGFPEDSAVMACADDPALYCIATDGRYRRRGVATALTLEALRISREAGHAVATLQASSMGRPVYERMGFTTVSYYRLFQFDPAEEI